MSGTTIPPDLPQLFQRFGLPVTLKYHSDYTGRSTTVPSATAVMYLPPEITIRLDDALLTAHLQPVLAKYADLYNMSLTSADTGLIAQSIDVVSRRMSTAAIERHSGEAGAQAWLYSNLFSPINDMMKLYPVSHFLRFGPIAFVHAYWRVVGCGEARSDIELVVVDSAGNEYVLAVFEFKTTHSLPPYMFESLNTKWSMGSGIHIIHAPEGVASVYADPSSGPVSVGEGHLVKQIATEWGSKACRFAMLSNYEKTVVFKVDRQQDRHNVTVSHAVVSSHPSTNPELFNSLPGVILGVTLLAISQQKNIDFTLGGPWPPPDNTRRSSTDTIRSPYAAETPSGGPGHNAGRGPWTGGDASPGGAAESVEESVEMPDLTHSPSPPTPPSLGMKEASSAADSIGTICNIDELGPHIVQVRFSDCAASYAKHTRDASISATSFPVELRNVLKVQSLRPASPLPITTSVPKAINICKYLSSGIAWDVYSAEIDSQAMVIKLTDLSMFNGMVTPAAVRRWIWNELRVYTAPFQHLQGSVVPKLGGYFVGCRGTEGGTDYWGVTLEDVGKSMDYSRFILDVQDDVRQCYKTLHNVGILHNDPRLEHMRYRLDESGNRVIRIIDFGFAVFKSDLLLSKDKLDAQLTWEELCQKEMDQVEGLLRAP